MQQSGAPTSAMKGRIVTVKVEDAEDGIEYVPVF
jgi:hypothetical protein